MNYKQLENKNFLNNQNYIISNKIKAFIISDYFFKLQIGDFSFEIINNLLRKIISYIYYIYNNKKNNKKIILLFLNLGIGLILYPIFILNIIFYFILFLYLSFFFLELFNNLNNSKIYIMSKKRNKSNKYFKNSYIETLIEYVRINDKIFKNNFNIFFEALIYMIISSFAIINIFLLI